MMKRLLLASVFALAALPVAAATVADFEGTWKVERVAGASDVVTGADPNTLLGTELRWNAAQVTSAAGTCKLVHATVAAVRNDRLETFLWGGQRISGLEISKEEAGTAFGKDETQVYTDGDGGCVEAVMLRRDRVLFMFQNGYLYLLDRVGR